MIPVHLFHDYEFSQPDFATVMQSLNQHRRDHRVEKSWAVAAQNSDSAPYKKLSDRAIRERNSKYMGKWRIPAALLQSCPAARPTTNPCARGRAIARFPGLSPARPPVCVRARAPDRPRARAPALASARPHLLACTCACASALLPIPPRRGWPGRGWAAGKSSRRREVVVADAALLECPGVVLGLFGPYRRRHAEDVAVEAWAQAAVAAGVVAKSRDNRALECDGPARHYPVEFAGAWVVVVHVLENVDVAPELAVRGGPHPPEGHALLEAVPAVLQAQTKCVMGVGRVKKTTRD
jgi:hypothetical protein